MAEQNVISVSCASDHNYLCGLWVTLHSICKHCAAGYTLRLHVLDCGLTEDDVQRLKALETTFTHCKVELCFHIVSLDCFKDCPTWRGGHAPYARLLLQDVLSEEDFTIYTDVDTLWLRDISELWSMRSQDYLLWAVRDGSELQGLSSGKACAERFNSKGFNVNPRDYYCSGLLMMNLKRLREKDFTTLVAQTLKDIVSDVVFPDQDLYNVLINGKDVCYVDFRWGEFAVVYGRRGGLDKPVVIHYAKSAPWKFKICFVTALWWKYLHHEAGYDVFGSEAKMWRKRARMRFFSYALRRSWAVRMLFRLLNRRSAKKYEIYLFPDKYPMPAEEISASVEK